MRILLACLVAVGCASQKKEAPAPAATAVAGSMPSNTGPGTAQATPAVPSTPDPAATAAAESGPMTAAEAAAQLAASLRGSAGDAAPAASAPDKEGPCASDADCALTRVAHGACCPMLCAPRVVTKKAAQALEENLKSCTAGHECPMPACRPPPKRTVPACIQNRCTARFIDEKGEQ